MNEHGIRNLLLRGKTPRQIAPVFGVTRKDVERVQATMRKEVRDKWFQRLIITTTIALFFGIVYQTMKQSFAEPTNIKMYTKIHAAISEVPSSATGAAWWMEHEPTFNPKDTKDVERDAKLIAKMTSRLNQTLETHKEIFAVDELKEQFGGNLLPSLFSRLQGGSTRMIGTKDNMAKINHPNMLEVVFYDRASFTHPKIRRKLLFYDTEWRAVILGAINISDDVWFDAILIHEMWHAKRHRDNAASATAPGLSDKWVEEEIEAHLIQRAILDRFTTKEYTNKIWSIASQKTARSLRRFLMQVTGSDLRSLDHLFRQPTPEELDLRLANYLLHLSFEWIRQNVPSQDQMQFQIDAYRMLVDPTQSTNVR